MVDRKIRVVVVDDAEFMRKELTRILESDQSIEVVGYGKTGQEGIEAVKAQKPDVVTLDIDMPEMDGITALKHIMIECPTPVVVVSALTHAILSLPGLLQTMKTSLTLGPGGASTTNRRPCGVSISYLMASETVLRFPLGARASGSPSEAPETAFSLSPLRSPDRPGTFAGSPVHAKRGALTVTGRLRSSSMGWSSIDPSLYTVTPLSPRSAARL